MFSTQKSEGLYVSQKEDLEQISKLRENLEK